MHPGTAEGIRYTVNTAKGKARRQRAICRPPRLSRVTARLRPEMDALPAYTPGRTVPGAIKIASNETVDGPLPSVRDAIVAAMDNINRYPDNGYAALRAGRASEMVGLRCPDDATFVVTLTTFKDVRSYPCRSLESATKLAERFIAGVTKPRPAA